MKQHTHPCHECPWRRVSAPGWLGASSPEEFVATSEAEYRMPCHIHVDYECEDWEEQAEEVPQCAGRAIHFANRCKRPRNPDLLVLPADRVNVFTQTKEFLDHHN